MDIDYAIVLLSSDLIKPVFASFLVLLAGFFGILSIKQLVRAKRNEMTGDRYVGAAWSVFASGSAWCCFVLAYLILRNEMEHFGEGFSGSPVVSVIRIAIGSAFAYMSFWEIRRAFRHEHEYDTRLGILWSVVFAMTGGTVVIGLF